MLKVNGRAILRLTGWHVPIVLFFLTLFMVQLRGPHGPQPVELAFSEFLKVGSI